MLSLKEVLAQNLRVLLKAKKRTQVSLAEELGVTEQTISAYTNAKTGISSDMIAKLARALQVDEVALIGEYGRFGKQNLEEHIKDEAVIERSENRLIELNNQVRSQQYEIDALRRELGEAKGAPTRSPYLDELIALIGPRLHDKDAMGTITSVVRRTLQVWEREAKSKRRAKTDPA